MSKEIRERFAVLMSKCSKFGSLHSPLCDLPVTEMGILHLISENGGGDCREGNHLDIQRIQDRLQISRPAISYNLNMLEKKEYIVREIDPKDRRRISIRITQKGAHAQQLSMQQNEDLWNCLMEEFGESEMNQLTELLTRFFEVLDGMYESGKF